MYTAHAKVRMQQRAIPSSVVNLLPTMASGRPLVVIDGKWESASFSRVVNSHTAKFCPECGEKLL